MRSDESPAFDKIDFSISTVFECVRERSFSTINILLDLALASRSSPHFSRTCLRPLGTSKLCALANFSTTGPLHGNISDRPTPTSTTRYDYETLIRSNDHLTANTAPTDSPKPSTQPPICRTSLSGIRAHAPTARVLALGMSRGREKSEGRLKEGNRLTRHLAASAHTRLV